MNGNEKLKLGQNLKKNMYKKKLFLEVQDEIVPYYYF